MKAFLFAPSNRLVGKLDVSSVDEVAKAVEAFAQGKGDIPNFSYVECGKRVWTITSVSPFQMAEGKVEKDPVVLPQAEPFKLSEFLSSAYRVTKYLLWGVAVLLLLGAIFVWLRTGKWMPLETKWLFKHFSQIADWVSAPSDWIGLAKVVWIISYGPWGFLVAILFTNIKEVAEFFYAFMVIVIPVVFVVIILMQKGCL